MTEMLLALAVFALATSLAAPALHNFYRLAERQFSISEVRGDKASVQAFLERVARSAPTTELVVGGEISAETPHQITVLANGDSQRRLIWAQYGEVRRQLVLQRTDLRLRRSTSDDTRHTHLSIETDDWSVRQRMLIDLPERCRFSQASVSCLPEEAI